MILPKIYKPNNEYMKSEDKINYFNKMIDNQEIMKKINSRPLFINYNLSFNDFRLYLINKFQSNFHSQFN